MLALTFQLLSLLHKGGSNINVTVADVTVDVLCMLPRMLALCMLPRMLAYGSINKPICTAVLTDIVVNIIPLSWLLASSVVVASDFARMTGTDVPI